MKLRRSPADLEDYRRLGVRPNETRLAVIRLAAARSSKFLAEKQLQRPTPQNGMQLSRVATSAYRLLDPRQRADAMQRAHVGRILPCTLSNAGETPFHDDGTRPSIRGPAFGRIRQSDQELVEMLDVEGPPRFEDEVQGWSVRLNEEQFLRRDGWKARWRRLPRRSKAGWGALVASSLGIGAALAFFQLSVRTPATLPSLAESPAAVAEGLLSELYPLDGGGDLPAASLQLVHHALRPLKDPLAATQLDGNLRDDLIDEQALLPPAEKDLAAIPDVTEMLQGLDLTIASVQQPGATFLADPFVSVETRPRNLPLSSTEASTETADSDPSMVFDQSNGPFSQASMPIADAAREERAAADPRPPADPQSGGQLSGRLVIDGHDLGVQLNYQAGVRFGERLWETLAEHLDRSLQGVSIRFDAEFELAEPAEVRVFLASADVAAEQSLEIDGIALSFASQRRSAVQAVSAGTHRVTWWVPADSTAASLQLRHAALNHGITLQPPADETMPSTRITVKLAP